MNGNDLVYLQHYGVSINKIDKIENISFEMLSEAMEKKKLNPIHKHESDLQADIVSLLDELKIDYHPSMSGLKKGSWGQVKFMKKQGIKKGTFGFNYRRTCRKLSNIIYRIKKQYQED
ncbi:hypothetical protein OFS03_07530 [Brachyspira hyodysenteriae]|nr:hypothetical protein [Brachyspira hyodysenteriae]MDA0063067.1 hypothetical protein [Brachyspira hyodysenteriae]